MSIGTNIKELREERQLTQNGLAELMDVSFQAVSSWERDEYRPDTEKLVKLAEVLEVSVTAIVEEKQKRFETKEAIYNWEHMKTFVKTTARNFGMRDTLKAVDFAVEAHEGQKRKKSVIPYIYHPLNLACHALSMGIRDDAVIAACLLHDVVEDCGKTAEDFPVNDECRLLVTLLSHEKTSPDNREQKMKEYYDAIAANPKAAIIKCIDRCNNTVTIVHRPQAEILFQRKMTQSTQNFYYSDIYIIN